MSVRFLAGQEVFDTDLSEPHLNLLAHAQSIELDIGSECGGHGACGKDRILIPASSRALFSKPSEEELHHLSPEELDAGLRLACQCFPEREDVELTIQVVSES